MALQAEPALRRMTHPRSVEEALRDMAADCEAVPVAGATWVMRAPLRHEELPERFVTLSHVDGFGRLDMAGDAISIGPMATHDRLARELPDTPDLRALRLAAGRAANPGVRRIATIGGNICTVAFAASDLAPALLCHDATVEIADLAGSSQLPMESFLSGRADREGPWLVTGMVVPRTIRLTAHQRLPMRRAGDYPCAIVSVAMEVGDAGVIRDARIAVGAVEPVARRWRSLEQALIGGPLVSARAEEAARVLRMGAAR